MGPIEAFEDFENAVLTSMFHGDKKKTELYVITLNDRIYETTNGPLSESFSERFGAEVKRIQIEGPEKPTLIFIGWKYGNAFAYEKQA